MAPSADFTAFQQGSPCLPGQMQVTDVLKTYSNGGCEKTGGKATGPELWAWIGVQSSNTTASTATGIDSDGSQEPVPVGTHCEDERGHWRW